MCWAGDAQNGAGPRTPLSGPSVTGRLIINNLMEGLSGGGWSLTALAFLLFHEVGLRIQGYVDMLPHHEAAMLHTHVPDHAEILPVDLSVCSEAETVVDFSIIVEARRSGPADIQQHRARHPMQTQFPVDPGVVQAGQFHPGTFKGDRRVFFRVKEVRAFKVIVPPFLSRINGPGVYFHLNGGGLDVQRIKPERPRDFVEPALNLGHHHVAHREFSHAMNRA